MSAPIRSMPELVDAIRARRDELNISHETIDNISGMAPGYTSKLLADGDRTKTAGAGRTALRGFSYMSLGAVLGALGICLHVVDDPQQRAHVESRWQKRKRPQRLVASLALVKPTEMADNSAQHEGFASMQIFGRAGGMASGKKRRAKAMKRRALQRVRSHAARMRWSKEKRV